ncbi:MAG: hypothetical protein OEX04_16590 [Acidimicrobiia bacterium]|nr:hypothetical protein [Acidimicrobiia bacterium]MDH4309087.1 hypothetical protein [Acidimicrobiia bacterium]MDH5294588.1 hypothetical protein [Acidimicrobiia bacterium]
MTTDSNALIAQLLDRSAQQWSGTIRVIGDTYCGSLRMSRGDLAGGEIEGRAAIGDSVDDAILATSHSIRDTIEALLANDHLVVGCEPAPPLGRAPIFDLWHFMAPYVMADAELTFDLTVAAGAA